jgi:hypothetical protein
LGEAQGSGVAPAWERRWPGLRRTCREQGSEAERGVWYEAEKRRCGEADGWDRPESGPCLSVKEREREKSMTGGPRVNQIKFELFQTYSNMT